MHVGYITNTWQSTTVHYISSTKEQKSYRILYQRCLGQSFQDPQTKVVCLPLLTCKVRRSQQSMTEGVHVWDQGVLFLNTHVNCSLAKKKMPMDEHKPAKKYMYTVQVIFKLVRWFIIGGGQAWVRRHCRLPEANSTVLSVSKQPTLVCHGLQLPCVH